KNTKSRLNSIRNPGRQEKSDRIYKILQNHRWRIVFLLESCRFCQFCLDSIRLVTCHSSLVTYYRRMTKTHKATCYCGAVEIELRGEPLEMGYCHCEACRRYSAAPVSAFTLWKIDNVKVTKGAEFLGKFKQSEMSDRRYCTK